MNIALMIIAALVGLLLYYYFIRSPLMLLMAYVTALTVLPPIPIGSIEISLLDYLALPTLILVIYNLSLNQFKLRGLIAITFSLFVVAAIISYISFTFQQTTLNMPMLMRLIRLIEMLLPILLIAQLYDRYPREKFILPFLIGSAITAVVGVIMFLLGVSLRESQMFAAGGELFFRAAGTHGGSGSFGALMGLATIVALWVILYFNLDDEPKKQRRYKLIALACGLCTMIGMIAALSRGGFVALAVGVILLLLPLLRTPKRFLKVVIVGVVFLLAVIPALDMATEGSLLGSGYQQFVERISGLSELADQAEEVTGGRTVFWKMAWDQYSSHPLAWPFGLGYKSLRLYYDMPPDNNFNQALFEMGVFGLLALLSLLYAIFKAAKENLEHYGSVSILLLALLLSIISLMVSADVMTYWHNIPPLFIMIISLSGRRDQSLAFA